MRAWLFVVAGGFLAGVVWRSCFEVSMVGVVALSLTAITIALVTACCEVRGVLVVACLCAGTLGIVRTEHAIRVYAAGAALVPAGTFINAAGTIVDEPDVRERHTNLTVVFVLDGERIRVRVRVPHHPVYTYGDIVTVRGTVREPEPFTTETGRVFDYPGYLRAQGVHAEIHTATVFRVDEGGGSTLRRALFAAKRAWLGSVSRLLSEPEASLAGGLIVGAKQSLGERWLRLFRDAGLIHLVVLSGYNLTLVAQGILVGVKRAPRLVAFGLGVCGVIGFALMTGASATVVRASLMAICAIAARLTGRSYLVVRALVLAAILMVLWNPFVLIFDPGFQLSFLATLGLIVGAPIVSGWLYRVPTWGGLREVCAATIATQLAVLPLIALSIGTVSSVALIANILVLPLVAPIMAIGFVAGVLGVVALPIGLPFALVAQVLLAYIFKVVELCVAIPGSSFAIPDVSPIMVIAAYTILGLLVWKRSSGTGGFDGAAVYGATGSVPHRTARQ